MLRIRRAFPGVIGLLVFGILAAAPGLDAAEEEVSNCEYRPVPFGGFQCCLCSTVMSGTPPVVSCKVGPSGWPGVYSCTHEFCSETGCPYEP